MRHTGIYAALIISSLLFINPSITLSEEGPITILKYSLKPVAYEKSGMIVKTRWKLNLVNQGNRPVSFIVRIILLDKKNNMLDEIKKKCEMDAGEVKLFSDNALIKESIARNVTLTRVSIEDINE
jgi:hypothetical protein